MSPEDADLRSRSWYLKRGAGCAYAASGARNGRSVRTLRLHRVIMERMIGPIPPGFEVHHKDKDTSNNQRHNLELIHKIHHGRVTRLAARRNK